MKRILHWPAALILCAFWGGAFACPQAEAVQLYLEYNPQPPFNAGSVATAPKEVTEFLNEMFEPLRKTADETALRSAKNI
jgi:cyclohexyl-isocyanide hydratase